MEQLSLFNIEDEQAFEVGSKQWKINKFMELNKCSFMQLEDLSSQIHERYRLKGRWFNDEDYYTDLVITDIFHSTKLLYFQKKYPKALVSYIVPPYLK